MTETDLARIEKALRIKLPAPYRSIMLAKGGEYKNLTYAYGTEKLPFFDDNLWLNPDVIISTNKAERTPGSGTAYAFPKWWQTFFLFGTDGAGGYYALKLARSRKVWMIGSDCDDQPESVAPSLDEYIAQRLQEYRPVVEPPPPPPPAPPVDLTFDPKERSHFAKWSYEVPSDEKKALKPILVAPEDDTPRLGFADWLEKQGQTQRANFVRARVALDDKAPQPDAYPAAIELLRRACEGLELSCPELPAPFSFYSSDEDLKEWWSDDSDAYEKGLPSLAQVDMDGDDENEPARNVKRFLPALIAKTPIRGINFNWYLPNHMPSILHEPATAALTRLEIDNRPEDNEPCPIITALQTAPVARNLTRLNINLDSNEANFALLAETPFQRLRRFDLFQFVRGVTTPSVRRLMAAPWFRRLERLKISLLDSLPAADLLDGMANLHTLALWMPDEGALKTLGSAHLPSLRRLFIHAAHLRKDVVAALVKLRCPQLVELWIRNSNLKKEDFKTLLAAPWAEQLQVLTLEGTVSEKDAFKVIQSSSCASHLQIRRIR